MKIIHLIEKSGRGGAATAAQRIHDALNASAEFKSILATFDNSMSIKADEIPLPISAEFSRNRLINRVLMLLRHFLPATGRNLMDYLLLRNAELEASLNQQNAEFILVHWVQPKRIGLRSLKRINSKIVFVLHDLRLIQGLRNYPLRGWVSDVKQQFTIGELLVANTIRRALPKKVRVVAPSEWVRKSALRLGWSPESVSEIPYPIDVDFWSPPKADAIKDGRDSVRFGFGYFGKGARDRKGQDLLEISATSIWQECKAMGFRVELHLFGDAELPENPKNVAKMIRQGHLDDNALRQLYREMDFLLVPSRFEALGQVALEAQSCGLPCIVMNNTGLTSAVAEGGSLLIRAPHQRALLDAIKEGLKRVESLREMRKAAREHSKSRNAPNRIALLYKKALTKW